MQKLGFVPISFHITSIENGWLFAELDLYDHHIDLVNSHLGGGELPKALIHVCNAVLLGNTMSQWLCWHGESHAIIWHIEKDIDQLCLKVYSIGCSFGLPVCGEGLAASVNNIDPYLTACLDIYTFAQSVCHAFKECRYGEMLEQWQGSEFKDHFPETEYQALRKLIRSMRQ